MNYAKDPAEYASSDTGRAFLRAKFGLTELARIAEGAGDESDQACRDLHEIAVLAVKYLEEASKQSPGIFKAIASEVPGWPSFVTIFKEHNQHRREAANDLKLGEGLPIRGNLDRKWRLDSAVSLTLALLDEVKSLCNPHEMEGTLARDAASLPALSVDTIDVWTDFFIRIIEEDICSENKPWNDCALMEIGKSKAESWANAQILKMKKEIDRLDADPDEYLGNKQHRLRVRIAGIRESRTYLSKIESRIQAEFKRSLRYLLGAE